MAKKSKPKLTDRQKKFLTEFNDSGCNVSASCSDMKISRETFYRWNRENELFAQRVEEIEEAKLDWEESKQKLTERQKTFLLAFDDLGCNISAACRGMKISRQTFYNWGSNNPFFKEQVDEHTEAQGDWVESKLIANIRDQKETSIIFYCKTKLKHRGYIETQKIENEGEISFLQVLQRYSAETAVEPLDEITDND